MGRTSITLGGVPLNSTVTNASGPRSATREELVELSAAHRGAVVFKSCNPSGLESPDNLKNPGVDYYAALARDLAPKGTVVWGSVVGVTADEIVDVARRLDRAGAKIIELNLADDFVANSVGPFKSIDALRALLKRVRAEVGAVIAVKVPPSVPRDQAGAIAAVFKETGVAIAVCANDLPKGLEFDLAKGTVKAPAGPLSQTHAFYTAGGGALDVVAVGGVEHRRRSVPGPSDRRQGGPGGVGPDQGRGQRNRTNRPGTRRAAGAKRQSVGSGNRGQGSIRLSSVRPARG